MSVSITKENYNIQGEGMERGACLGGSQEAPVNGVL